MMVKVLEGMPELRREISYIGAVTLTKSELRVEALQKILNTVAVEALTSKKGLIFKGTKVLRNALYADWIETNLKNVAPWHNNEKKGDVIEASLGLA